MYYFILLRKWKDDGFEMIDKSSKNKNNGLVYMINEETKMQQERLDKNNIIKYTTTKRSIKIGDRQIKNQQQLSGDEHKQNTQYE